MEKSKLENLTEEDLKRLSSHGLVDITKEGEVMDINENQYLGMLSKKIQGAYSTYMTFHNLLNEVMFLKNLGYRMKYAVNKQNGQLYYKFEERKCGFEMGD